MDGAASGMAVVSLALQLGGRIKQLYNFWRSVQEAPDDIHAMTGDLSLLSSVLAEMASEEQHFGLDHTLVTILEACCDRVNKLTRITNDIEPGFESTSRRIRRWTAFKAVLKGERIQSFQKVLEGLKLTLILAQQNYHSRLSRMRHQSQQQNLVHITRHLSSLNSGHMPVSISTFSNRSSSGTDHASVAHDGSPRICQTMRNPVQRVDSELVSNMATQDLATIPPKNKSTTSWRLAATKTDRPAASYHNETWCRSRQQKTTKDLLSLRDTITQTFLGVISTTTKACLLRTKPVDGEALDHEGYQYEHESSFKYLPAQWLLKLGFNYAYNLSIQTSSTQGLQCHLRPISLVPDDALIFEYCRQGNIEKVRELISKRLASVRDVDSEGRTALHLSRSDPRDKFAAGSHHPELCKFLINAGANRSARTFRPWFPESPLIEILRRSITKNGLVNAVDTCRIFEDSFDFWDEKGEGWDVLGWIHIFYGGQSTGDIEATLTLLLWLIQSSRPDIEANYHTGRICKVMHVAHSGLNDAMGLLLELGPHGIIENLKTGLYEAKSRGSEIVIFSLITTRKWDQVKLLHAFGANPHDIRCCSRFSSVTEIPGSLAVYSPWVFWKFRNALRARNVRVQDITGEELEQGCPLLDAGWQIETPNAFLRPDSEPDIELPELYKGMTLCHSCKHFIHGFTVHPYWQCILESIRNRIHPQSIGSDFQIDRSSSSQSYRILSDKATMVNSTDGDVLLQNDALPKDQSALPDEEPFISETDIPSSKVNREKMWCIWCWHHFEETGHRRSPIPSKTQSLDGDDSSEDDFSPFLFNT